MTKTTLLRDSAKMRWTMLIMVALTMFAVYVVSDIFSPLKPILEEQNGWTSTEYGAFQGSYSLFNIVLGMLIFGGIILDKKGIRFTGIVSSLLMVTGIAIKYWAISTPSLLESHITIFGAEYKMQVIWAILGWSTFGVGAEVIGISVSKAIVKWFKGKELALAMGLQLALARTGAAAAFIFSPMLAKSGISTPVLVGLSLIILGTICFITYSLSDKKLDKQIKEQAVEENKEESSFSVSDIKKIISNPGFWHIAILCVLFYSAVFPFLKFAADLMVNKFAVDPNMAGTIPALLPFGCILLTPLFGGIYDRIGKGADLMVIGAVIIAVVHSLFAAPFVQSVWIAIPLMILLGVAFSLVPSAMWPSLAKIMPEKQYGSAIALVFYVQNIGLLLVPFIIGVVLDNNKIPTEDGTMYNYTPAMMIFACLCIASILVALSLKRLDKKKGYGLQIANMQKKK